MRVKLLKARLFNMIPQYEYVLYVDSDVLFGAPLRPFLRVCLRALLAREALLALFPDIGISKAPYHTGVLFMHRQRSAALLRGWEQRIASGKFKKGIHLKKLNKKMNK